ncbi:MAG: response regulator [SAR324 cluster bacterium]|uniref:Response regulator n=1 Tax=SAR324 cluster bacterium TaxID=2024889 RepID=A0A7X9FRI1_9DELT|nr:response regulator [SAR324 cluster bacterium]
MQEQKKTILCVDDDPDVLNYLQTVIEANGFSVVLASSAESAVRLYKQQSPDLIIVDLMMEEVDSGTELVRTLKAEGNKAPIYMLSSVGDSLSTMTDYSALGLSGVLQKPINPDALLKILTSKLG